MKVAVFCKECNSKLMLEESLAETIEKCPVCGAAFCSTAKTGAQTVQETPVKTVVGSGVVEGCSGQDCGHVAPLVKEMQVEGAPVVDNNNPNDDFEIILGRLRKYKGAGGNVVIPKTVVSIDAKAFFNCKTIQTLVVPFGVRTIGEKAFFGCDNLVEVSLPETVTSIGEGAFIGSKLQGINVDAKNRAYCSIDGDLYTKDKTTVLQVCAGKSLSTMMLPAETKKIAPYAFFDCRNLQKLILPEAVQEIGAHAFYNCLKLHQIDNSSGLRSIGVGAFAWCKKLCEFTVPENCSLIEEKAFEHCSCLEQVFISSGVTKIGIGAFMDCVSLEKVCFAIRNGWYADGESVSQTILSNEKKAAKLLRETYVGMTWTFGKNIGKKDGKSAAKKESAFNNDLRDLVGKSF